MTSEIDLRLKELIALWIDGTPSSLQRIPALCDEVLSDEMLCKEITGLSAPGGCKLAIDPALLHRAGLLSIRGERRLAACLEIQSRTGSYSTDGALELSPRIVTTGWEG